MAKRPCGWETPAGKAFLRCLSRVAGAFRANLMLSGGVLTRHSCPGMRSGAPLHPPGSAPPLSDSERLGFSGLEVTSHHACQHHGTGPILSPGRQRCVLLFHRRYQWVQVRGRATAGVPGWLRYPERTTLAQCLPPTRTREAKPRSSAKAGSSSAHRERSA